MRSDLIDIDVRLLQETERAVQVTLDTEKHGVWLTLSKVELSPTGKPGIYSLTLPKWLANERGLI